MLKAVLFDLDRTLIDWDSAEPWEVYQARRLKKLHDFVHRELHPLSCNADEFFETFALSLGNAWKEGNETLIAPSVMRVLDELLRGYGVPEDRLDMHAVMTGYDWQPAEGERAYPDVLEVLPELRAHGIQLGIVTNATLPMQHRDRELAAAGILELFPHCRISAVEVGYLKPHRAIFERALEMLDVRPEEAVFVGDNLRADVRGAQAVGMYAVWRAEPGEELPAESEIEPDGTIRTLHELLPLLDRWYPNWRANGHHKP
ncbi:MAG: HAD family hydrolase [Chloroflexi bacterium]|jgi:putative hydrolase of the HAD superfamily|nr:HAD family hydrolase [Chloroflexota bacterium]